MSDKKVLAAFLAVTVAVAGGSAWAASEASSSSGQTTVQKDFGKLSADGAHAYQDLTLTRLAIYDGQTDQAKKYIGDADTAFAKTKTDDSVFMKAEGDLKTSQQVAAKGAKAAADTATEPKAAGTSADKDKTASAATGAKAIAWLPVDGAISLNEDYRMSPEKTKAVADANKSIEKGDRKGALEKLKLADVNTSVVLEVLPLDQTLSDVHQAAQLIDGGKYYEGSQMLRKVQMAARYDVADYFATPKAASAAPASSNATQPADTKPSATH